MNIKALLFFFVIFLLVGCSFPFLSQESEPKENYRIYIPGIDIDMMDIDNIHKLIEVEKYKDEFNMELIGEYEGSQEIIFPEDTEKVFIYFPRNTILKLDAVAFLDSNSNILGYIGYDVEGNPVGSYMDTSNVGFDDGCFNLSGQPDGLYSTCGVNDEGRNLEGFLMLSMTGFVGDTGSFSGIKTFIIAD